MLNRPRDSALTRIGPQRIVLAAKELEEAKRRFLDAQSAMEYARRMSDYHADRIKRLTNYLESSE